MNTKLFGLGIPILITLIFLFEIFIPINVYLNSPDYILPLLIAYICTIAASICMGIVWTLYFLFWRD